MRELNPENEFTNAYNGSGSTDKWWKELAELKVKTVFGIDDYRIPRVIQNKH